MTLAPRIEGTVSIRSPWQQFASAVRERVSAGTLLGPPHPRSRYAIVETGSERVRIRAADWSTAIGVGLNELELEFPGASSSVRYEVRYWRWAAFALGLSGALGIAGVVLLVAFDLHGYVERNPAAQVPGLSVDQVVWIAWGMVLFWGFIWPWLLIGLHKGPLHGLVARIVADADTGVTTDAPGRGRERTSSPR